MSTIFTCNECGVVLEGDKVIDHTHDGVAVSFTLVNG